MNKILHWFVKNPVTSNLLMAVILLGGVVASFDLKTQIFPPAKLNAVDITIEYSGATPEIIARNISVPVENALKNIEGIKNVYSFAVEEIGTTTVFFYSDVDIDEKVSEIKRKIDALGTLPKGIERPQITETKDKDRILDIAIHGNVDLETLTRIGELVKNKLISETSASDVKLFSAPKREISIEISSDNLRRTGLSLKDIANAISVASVNVPAGSIGHGSNQISIRGNERAYHPDDFEYIPVVNKKTGEKILLGEIAEIKFDRKDVNFISRFNGENASGLEVFISEGQDLLGVRDEIGHKITEIKNRLPQNVGVTIWLDDSKDIAQRLTMLLDNALVGMCLVFVVLILFLNLKLAFWVCTGIVISFTGGIWLLPAFDISLNHLSTFAFLLILGVVVDDAIVVGESVYNRQQKNGPGAKSAFLGVKDVWKPVFLGVLTTIAAAVPGLMFKSIIGSFLFDISFIIVAVLCFSLIESLLILPCHLVTFKPGSDGKFSQLIKMPRRKFQKGLRVVILKLYRPLVKRAVVWRYFTLSIFFSIAVLSAGLVISGKVPMQLFPNMVEGQIISSISMNRGTTAAEMHDTMLQLEESFEAVLPAIISDFDSTHEDDVSLSTLIKNRASFIADNDIYMLVELDSDALKTIPVEEIEARWQKELGVIPNAKKVNFSSSEDGDANSISLKVFGPNSDQITLHVNALKQKLLRTNGVFNFTVTQGTEQKEFLIDLLPEGMRFGANVSSISNQLSEAFYGTRVDRLPGVMETMDVNLRLPDSERLYVENIEDFPVKIKDQDVLVPFTSIAKLRDAKTPGYIERINGQQIATVNVNFDEDQWTRFELLNVINDLYLEDIRSEFPHFSYKLDGDAEEEEEFLSESFRLYVIFFFVIYAILAIGSNSYLLPFIILTAVPFGLVGAILGHNLFGLEINAFSIMGVLAAAGVVINDNLVLIDQINKLKQKGVKSSIAILHGSVSRFRPIVLTSLTTFFGLLPILFETSYQAQFVIPMAISLAFGVILATFVTLLLIPSLYEIGLDISRIISFFRNAMKDDKPRSPIQTQVCQTQREKVKA
ncbi:efflux RND transporter permease subunit [Kiloniella majae]|uniref:efflux RND transporter permease subunit n=1 Tax=Kiloniella majae TaxID=1938558 RepID=UPI000A278043|nr:efflux RND transporter permease subunit [Kiloniella majae]